MTRENAGTVDYWSRVIIASVARGSTWFFVGLLPWAVLPGLFGCIPSTVVSDSMAPAIVSGSVVVAVPAHLAELVPGRVALASDPDDSGRMRLHRIVERRSDDVLITRGDANEQDDSTPVTLDAVKGIGYLLVPFIGIPVKAAHDGDWLTLVLVVVGVVLLLWMSNLDRKYLGNKHLGDSREGGD